MTIIALDTETRLFKPGYMAPKVVCISVSEESNTYLWHGTGFDSISDPIERRIQNIFERALHDKYTHIVGHNIAYDMACIYESYPNKKIRSLIWDLYDNKKIQCTMCREKLLDIAAGQLKHLTSYSLAKLCKKYFNIEMDKDTWRLSYSKLENIHLDDWPIGAKEYAIDDAKYTADLYDLQESNSRNFDYRIFPHEAARQASYAFALQLTMCRGMILDQDRVKEIDSETTSKMHEYYKAAKKHNLWHTVNKKEQKNTKELKKLILQCYPGEVPRTKPSKTFPNGQVKTDERVLKECNHPGITALFEYKKLEKIKSTYINPFIEIGDRSIHPSYDPIKETGRTSSFKPNIQNQPRKGGIRECFIARPGWVFIFCDYDSQEVRTLAESCFLLGIGSALGEKYQNDPDFDPHSYFAGWTLNITYSEAIELKKNKDEVLLDRRQRAKAANFGFPGGLGVTTFIEYAKGYDVDLSFDEAQKLRDDWFATWPEMKQYFNIISNLTQYSTGTVQQLVSGRLRGECVFTQAANSFFQGLAADVSKYALYQVARKCFDVPGTSALSGCRSIAFIHDEIGVEAPKEYATLAARELERTMIGAMEELCIHVPSRASATLMHRWSKDEKHWVKEID